MRSDNYAFVLMKDEEGYRRATQQAVRLFGIQIEVMYTVFLMQHMCSFQ
jgi:hypothetical protein